MRYIYMYVYYVYLFIYLFIYNLQINNRDLTILNKLCHISRPEGNHGELL